MKINKLSFLLLVNIVAIPLHAAPQPQPLTGAETPPTTKPTEEQKKLHMANPFYLPYARELQLSFQLGMLQNGVRQDIPAQTFLGFPISASFREAQFTSYPISIGVKYGILDRLIIGGGFDTFAPGKTENTQSGLNYNTYGSPTVPSGFAGAELSAYGRLAGTRPGQIYLDIGIQFRPGLASSESTATNAGRLSATGAIATGINFWWVTIGAIGGVTYAPSASVKRTSGTGAYTTSVTVASAPAVTVATGQFVLQLEWRYAYARGMFGYSKYVDSSSADDPILKYSISTYGGAIGFKFGEKLLLEFNGNYSPAIKGDEYFTGYQSSLKQFNTIAEVTRYTVTFSWKIP